MSQQQPSGESRMERRKERTRQRIIQAALTLFREQGLDATTMEAIAEAADVAKGTLYNHFAVKEAIVDEYIRRNFQQRGRVISEQIRQLPDTAARVERVFGELLAGVQAQPAIFEKYVVYRMRQWISFHQQDHEKSGFYLLAAEIVQLGRADGELRSDLPAGILQDLCEYVFMLAVKEYYLDPASYDTASAIRRSTDLFLNGSSSQSRNDQP